MSNQSAAASPTRVFDALGEPVRRQIIARLRSGPTPVGKLADQLTVGRPAVSKHLRVLEGAGLVRHESRGTRNLYALAPEGMVVAQQWLVGHVGHRARGVRRRGRRGRRGAAQAAAMRPARSQRPSRKKRTDEEAPHDQHHQPRQPGLGRRPSRPCVARCSSTPAATSPSRSSPSRIGGLVAARRPQRVRRRRDGRVRRPGRRARGSWSRRTGADDSVWGTVTRWEPGEPDRVHLASGQGPEAASKVVVTFEETDGKTLVTLEHTGWESFGERAAEARENYASGWPVVLGRYAERSRPHERGQETPGSR